MKDILTATIAQSIAHYMNDQKIMTVEEFNKKNDFTPLKTALLPFLIASAARDTDECFRMYAPWKLQEVLPADEVHQPIVRMQRMTFHSSAVVPFIDFPDDFTAVGYQERYKTIVPENFVAEFSPLFPKWSERATMQLTPEKFKMFRGTAKNDIIEESLLILDERESNPISYEAKLLSYLLDRSSCFMVARIFEKVFKAKEIPLDWFIGARHIFAFDPEKRILC